MPTLKITNLREFEARLSGGVKNLSNATFKEVKKDAQKFFEGLPNNVANSADFQRLQIDGELRGKLGLALASRKTGGDTDAPDLIKELAKFKVTTRSTRNTRKFLVTFPSVAHLEQRLTHSLSSVFDGVVRPGPRESWFRWWEFGDRGEIDSLTVLTKTIQKLVATKSGSKKKRINRGELLDIIRSRSRSAQAIQLEGRTPDINSKIEPTGLVRRTYGNYARVFPARMGKTLRRIVTRNNGRAERFFARGVTG